MSLFGKLVRTTINTALLPAAMAEDILTLGGDSLDGGKTYTQKQLETIKREAEDNLEEEDE